MFQPINLSIIILGTAISEYAQRIEIIIQSTHLMLPHHCRQKPYNKPWDNETYEQVFYVVFICACICDGLNIIKSIYLLVDPRADSKIMVYILNIIYILGANIWTRVFLKWNENIFIEMLGPVTLSCIIYWIIFVMLGATTPTSINNIWNTTWMGEILNIFAISRNRLHFKNWRNSMEIREIAKLWENLRNRRIVWIWRNRVISRNLVFQFKLYGRAAKSRNIIGDPDPSFASISWSISGLPLDYYILNWKLNPSKGSEDL